MRPNAKVTQTERPLTNTWATAVQKIATIRTTLLAMVVLQLLWLAGIWITSAATADYKLLPLVIYTLLGGVVIIFLPQNLAQKLHQLVTYLTAHQRNALIGLAMALLIGGGYYASQQRLWPFDEEASYEAAITVAEKGIVGLFENYKNWGWLATQHPPLAPIVFGQALRLLGISLTMARLVSVVFSIGTGLLTYGIGRELYDGKTGLVAACFLFTFPLLMRLSGTAMVEPMLTFFFTMTLFLTLRLVRTQKWGYLMATGLFVGLGLLTKYTMVFVLPILLGFILLKGNKRQIVPLLIVLGLTVFVSALAWFLVASRIDVFQTQMATIWHYAGLVLTNTYGRQVLFETVTNRLPSALGVYNIPLIALGGFWLVMRRQRSDWLLLLWITAVWLPLIVTLPDHRYFMSSFPAVALAIAVGFQFLPKLLDRTVLLAILYCLGSLYLFVDWSRAAQLFIV